MVHRTSREKIGQFSKFQFKLETFYEVKRKLLLVPNLTKCLRDNSSDITNYTLVFCTCESDNNIVLHETLERMDSKVVLLTSESAP